MTEIQKHLNQQVTLCVWTLCSEYPLPLNLHLLSLLLLLLSELSFTMSLFPPPSPTKDSSFSCVTVHQLTHRTLNFSPPTRSGTDRKYKMTVVISSPSSSSLLPLTQSLQMCQKLCHAEGLWSCQRKEENFSNVFTWIHYDNTIRHENATEDKMETEKPPGLDERDPMKAGRSDNK